MSQWTMKPEFHGVASTYLFKAFQLDIKLVAACFLQFTETVRVGLQRWIRRHRKPVKSRCLKYVCSHKTCFRKTLIILISIFHIYFCLSSFIYLEFFLFPLHLSIFRADLKTLLICKMRIFETENSESLSNSFLTLWHTTQSCDWNQTFIVQGLCILL